MLEEVSLTVDGRSVALRAELGDSLLRAMRDHPQYTPADSLALCRGFAPFARLREEVAADAVEDAPTGSTLSTGERG